MPNIEFSSPDFNIEITYPATAPAPQLLDGSVLELSRRFITQAGIVPAALRPLTVTITLIGNLVNFKLKLPGQPPMAAATVEALGSDPKVSLIEMPRPASAYATQVSIIVETARIFNRLGITEMKLVWLA